MLTRADDSLVSRVAVGSRIITAALVVLYILAWALSPLLVKTTPSDLDIFFWPSAETVVGGHPLLIYSAHIQDSYPNANGPLGLVLLVPVAALANALGWAGNLGLRAGLTDAVVALFVLLLARETVVLIRRERGIVEWRLAAACTILFAPALWIGVIDYGHIEQPLELGLVLLAVRCVVGNRPVAAGVALGAAMLARTTALLYLIPVLLLPVATRRVTPAAKLAVAALITVAAGLAPFLIADGPAVAHSLITYRGSLPIAGGSFWLLARQTSWAGFAQHGDVYVTIVVAVILTALTLRRRPSTATTARGLLGLLTVVACCFPLFAKTVYPYYLLEPYVFGAAWWLARPGNALNWRASVPLLLTADVFLAKSAATLPFEGWGLAEGVTSSVILAVVVALVSIDVSRKPTAPQVGYPRSAQRSRGGGDA
jgi:uncharacterized membrane protein